VCLLVIMFERTLMRYDEIMFSFSWQCQHQEIIALTINGRMSVSHEAPNWFMAQRKMATAIPLQDKLLLRNKRPDKPQRKVRTKIATMQCFHATI
jgi:hypothetical protein